MYWIKNKTLLKCTLQEYTNIVFLNKLSQNGNSVKPDTHTQKKHLKIIVHAFGFLAGLSSVSSFCSAISSIFLFLFTRWEILLTGAEELEEELAPEELPSDFWLVTAETSFLRAWKYIFQILHGTKGNEMKHIPKDKQEFI